MAAVIRLGILDTPKEKEFDDLVELAAVVSGAPIAALTIVDNNRVWYKSTLGFDVSESDREGSFCDYALREDSLFEVPDAQSDPRFASTPLVAGIAQIRFYAGQPLLAEDGSRVGTICILDRVPRELSSSQRIAMELFSKQAVALLEGRLARLTLANSLEHYTQLHESMRDAFAQVDISGQLVDVNPAFCELVGYTREECLQLNSKELTPDNWREFEQPMIEGKLDQEGFSDVYEKEYIRKDGTKVPVELRVVLLRDRQGVPQTRWAIIRDISERKRAEQELKEREEKYRFLFENMTTGFALHEIICDDDGKPADYRYLEINPAFESLTGLSSKQLLGKTILEVVPETEPYWIEVFGNVALTGEPIQYENLSAELGKHFSVWAFSPSYGQFAVIISDTTKTKLIQAELLKNERRLALAISATSDAVWDRNYQTGESYFSPRWYEMIGYDESELPMNLETWRAIAHPDDIEKAHEDICKCLEPFVTTGYQSEYRVRRGDGTWRWILSRGKVVERDENGGAILLSGTNADITERKEAEQALKALNETLEDRVAQRTAALAERNDDLELFSYAISHDLRAPLRIIRGYATFLSEEIEAGNTDDVMEFVERIAKSAEQMSEMLDGILAYARIGTASAEPTEVDLKDFMSNIVSEVQSQSGADVVQLTAGSEDTTLLVDSDALSICVRNLLHNAVKFASGRTDPEVKVHTKVSSNRCQIVIKDNGVGFDMADSERIFQMFQRLRPSSPGTGVGLALVARAVSRLDGLIHPESELGKGATFTLDIPIGRSVSQLGRT
jgi:PAS domain S-box-containing protein